jgi:mono/diheme cytochrome c family protein
MAPRTTEFMKFSMLISSLAALWILGPAARGRASPSAHSADAVAHGRYIVEGVAVCWTCHTPRDPHGAPDRSRWLLGAPIVYEPTASANWADIAPRLAGSPPGTADQFIRLMMTGISRTGNAPRPPMPQFRMSRSDAESVLAYLKSLQ